VSEQHRTDPLGPCFGGWTGDADPTRWGSSGDAIADLLDDVLQGRFPPPDGGFTVIEPDRTTGQHAVLCFTGHAVVATDRSRDEVEALGVDGVGAAHHPDVLRALAGPGGWIGVLDAVLVAPATGVGGTSLRWRDDLDDHPRVRYARAGRVEVRVLADERGLVTVGRGLGGRTEIGMALLGDDHGTGLGRSLVADALAELPAGEAVWASCSPGNARSLRALLALGFVVVGSESLLRPVTDR
jgi:hypothetical protein